jgi:hypothetical protein
MPESFGFLDSVDFFRGALPEAVFWGRLALGVGIAGLAVSLFLALVHLRDQLSLKRGRMAPLEYRAPKWGPLNRCLGDFFADPLHVAPLSPDAASEYVTGRLDAQHDLTHSAVRYFSHAPLLLGLMGTTFALRTLLVTGGDTLQEIQPQLSGVFAGTLAGIGGSLIAALGGLLLDRVALSTANRAQDFIHRHIIPTLPERRIAIKIEDAVLAMIAERAQVVAESLRLALQPVAADLEGIAVRCGTAAEAATNAFSEAARAVREAGNLEAASRNFKSGAHMIDSSAEQLVDATKQTAEIILRAGEVRGSLATLLERIHVTSEGLSSASERVGSQVSAKLTDLNTQLSRIETCTHGLSSAVETLSAELLRRVNEDSAQVDAIKGYADMTGRTLASLTQIALESSDGIKLVRSAVDAADGKAVDAIKREITPRLDESARRTDDAVRKLDRVLDERIATVTGAVTEIRQRLDGGYGVDSNRTAADLQQVLTEVKRASDETKRLSIEVQRLHSTTPGDGVTRKGLFRRLWN